MGSRVQPPNKPYHLMTEEERREAWASLRARQTASARRHHRTPIVLGLLTLTLFVTGLVLAHLGERYAGFLLWASVGTAGFAVIALLRNMIGSITSRKDDLTPPGF